MSRKGKPAPPNASRLSSPMPVPSRPARAATATVPSSSCSPGRWRRRSRSAACCWPTHPPARVSPRPISPPRSWTSPPRAGRCLYGNPSAPGPAPLRGPPADAGSDRRADGPPGGGERHLRGPEGPLSGGAGGSVWRSHLVALEDCLRTVLASRDGGHDAGSWGVCRLPRRGTLR